MAKKVKTTKNKIKASATSNAGNHYKSGKVKVTKNKTKSKSYVAKFGTDSYKTADRSIKSSNNRKTGVSKEKTQRNANVGYGGSTRISKSKTTPNKTKQVTKKWVDGYKTKTKRVVNKRTGRTINKTR